MSKTVLRVCGYLPLVVSFVGNAALAQPTGEFHHLQGGLVNDIKFLDSQRGWTAEDGGRIRYTSNGGSTWQNADFQSDYRGDLFGLWLQADGAGNVTGFAVGDFGIVLKNSDSAGHVWAIANPTPIGDRFTGTLNGQTYNCMTNPHPAKLQGIFMTSTSIGWCVGERGAIASTADGGQTWTNSGIALPPAYNCGTTAPDLYKIHFFEDPSSGSGQHWKYGIVVSEDGHVLVTTDFGATWIYRDPNTAGLCPPLLSGESLEFWSMTFSNPLEYSSSWWICGGVLFTKGYIFKSTNQGVSWTQENSYKELLNSSGFIPPPIIDVPTLYGITTLGGSTPTAMCVGYGQYAFTKATSDTPNFDPCTLTQISGSPTSDTWVQRDVNAQSQVAIEKPAFFSVAKTSANTAVLGGAFGRIVKYDEAASTKFTDTATTALNRLRDGAFIKDSSFNKGLVCGQGWSIWDTSDAGVTWSPSPQQAPGWSNSTTNYARGIDISTSSAIHGACVGSGGFVAHGTFNGSAWSWKKLENSAGEIPATLSDLNAVAFVPGSLRAFAVGNSGLVIRSTDGGATWQAVTAVASGASLFGVSFISDTSGYICGANGECYKTTNGGTSWSSVSWGTGGTPTNTFYDVAASSGTTPETVVVVGVGGTIYRKASNSFTFHKVTTGLGTTDDLYDVEILSNGVDLRIGGAVGTTLFFDNPTWTTQKSGTTFPLFKMSFKDATHGFAIGSMFVVASYY